VSVTFTFDTRAFDAQVEGLAGDLREAIRPAAQAGAQVLYEEVKRNVGRLKKHTGNLERSIYQVFKKEKSSDDVASYGVSWSAKKAPHGHLVEFGHLQRYEITYDPKTKRFTTHKDRPLAVPKLLAAKPFVRPARAKYQAALAAAQAELFKRMAKK
jgi:hypothetical protein